MPLSGGGQISKDFIHASKFVWKGYHGSGLVWEPVEKLIFRTSGTFSTVIPFWVNRFNYDVGRELHAVVRRANGTLVKEVPLVNLGVVQNIDVEEENVRVYIKAHEPTFKLIRQFDIASTGKNGIVEVHPEIFPNLTTVGFYNQNLTDSTALNASLAQLPLLEQLLIYSNSLTGYLDVSQNPAMKSLEFFGNNYTSMSPITHMTQLGYFNSADNNSLTGTLDFRNSTKIHTVITFRCDFTQIRIDGCATLKRFDTPHNLNLVQSFDFTSNPIIEVISLSNCPVTESIWSANNTVKGYFLANSTVPEAQTLAGIAANIGTLEALSIQSQGSYVGPFNLDNATNLGFLWLDDLPLCTGFSILNTGGITNLNIAGMHLLTTLPSLASNPLNALVWITGTGIGSAGADAVINYVSAQGIAPIQEHPVGPGGVIYGDYELATGPLFPTAASLSSYNDLVARGYTIIGAIPA